MSSCDFSVVTSVLRQAAVSAASVTGNVSAAGDRVRSSSSEIVSEHRGWSSAAALEACVIAWQKRLVVLSDRVDQIVRILGRTADNYEGADAAVEDLVKQVATELRGR